MPGKTAGPGTAVKLEKGDKLRMVLNVNKGRGRAFPEKITVPISTPHKTGKELLPPWSSQEEIRYKLPHTKYF